MRMKGGRRSGEVAARAGAAARVSVLRGFDSAALAAVAELVVAAAVRGEALGLREDVTRPEYEEHLKRLMSDAERGDAGLAVARAADGTVVGSAQWTRSPYPTRRVLAELDRVVVSPQSRGAGLGTALVDAIAGDAQAAGVEVLMLEARGNNHAAIALYEREGFRRVGALRNVVAVGAARHDVILMSRALARPKDADLLGDLPAGQGASLPRGVTRGAGWQRTERLLLCVPAPESDVADAYFAIHADPATNVHNPAGPMVDPAAAAPVLELWQRHWRAAGFGYWVVRDAAGGRIIGFAGVRPVVEGEDFLNLYYRFHPSVWGRGYATEVGRAALALAASMAPGVPVVALIRPRNEPSIRVAQRLGMRLEGEVQRQFGIYLRYALVPPAVA
ncbi:GNAT family N-acetyltransferase [Actinocrinis puniceicyclus]|uniref:GNAT family N-acetyltransferase n=1 Tax=Actinocrinis puniceicyclus TaxID=977794 RepID=A0A8J7WLQ4_9ACTN|nr:GNAT family N-acetyltransferase [Actinocrinis puniceicyclus]MBS2964676.1 GNAT family N-acetyltransferase [Actinocrinis puniceicyclus]